MNKSDKVTLNLVIGTFVTCGFSYLLASGLHINPWSGALVGLYAYIFGLAYADHNPKT